MTEEQKKEERTWIEEIEVFGQELVDTITEIIEEGNVRRVTVRSVDGRVLLDIPLSAGVAVGGAVAILAPLLAVLGTLAALAARVKIEVVRTGEPDKPAGGEKPSDTSGGSPSAGGEQKPS